MKLFRSRYFILALVLCFVMPHVVKALVGVLHPKATAVASVTESGRPPAAPERD
jgi:hypothetical protein